MATVRQRTLVVTRKPKPRRYREEKPAPVSEPKGLCLTCNHSSDCSFRRNPDQPVLFCEEFDSYTPPVIEETVTEPAPTLNDLKEWDEYKGLCVNCENRKDCVIRDKEIGVWHCEEYI